MRVHSRVPDVTRIAVLRANALGDYLFCLPALDALRVAYPDAEIVLLGAPWHARTLAGRPGPVDRFLVAPALPGIRAEEPDDPVPATDAGPFFEKLAAERFDLAIQAHGGGRNSNPVVARLGARVTAGSATPDAPPLDRTVRYTFYQPEVFRYLEIVGLVGAVPVTVVPRFDLVPSDHAEAARALGSVRPDSPGGPDGGPASGPDGGSPGGPASGPDTGPPRVALHPGASDTRRRWPAERFAAVGDALAEAGAEVVVTGTGPERATVELVASAMRAPAGALVDAVTVGGLAALYARCALVVSNDTGPLHLAAAVGTRTVGLFWVGNLINGAGAYRDRHRAVASWTIHCPECGLDCTLDLYPDRGGPPPCGHRPSFLTDIPVSEVVAEALDLYAGAVAETAGPDAGPRWTPGGTR